MKKIIWLAAILFVLSVYLPAFAQSRYGFRQPRQYDTRSAYLLLGYAWGPHFSDFIDWANNYYASNFNSTDRISDFDGGLSMTIGLRNRFSPNFALEFDFAIHSVGTKKTFLGQGPAAGFQETQNLDLNIAAFTISPMILFEFSEKQLVVPFVSAGVTIYSLRLDHVIDYGTINTKVAPASNFSAGLETRLGRKLWGDIRGDWTIGRASMPVSYINNEPDRFDLSLNTVQFHLGIIYGID